MAEFKEFKVKVSVDTSEGTKNVEKTITSLEEYQKTLDELNKRKTKPGISADELKSIDSEIKTLGKSFTKAGNEVDKSNTSMKATSFNLRALKKELKGTEVGTAEFKRLTQQIDDMTDELKAAGRTSKSFTEQLEAAPGPIGKIFSGLETLKGNITSVGAAWKATGIGLLVSIIGGITAAFAGNENAIKKLEPLLNGLQKIVGGLFRVFEPLLDSFVEMAEVALPYVTKGIGIFYSSLVGLFTYIKEAGTGLAKIYQGIFTLDAKKIGEGVDQIKNSFQTAAKAGTDAYARFTQGSQELTKKEKEEQEKRAEQDKKDKEDKAARDKKSAEDSLANRKKDLDAEIELEKNKSNTSRAALEELLRRKDELENQGTKMSKAQLDLQAENRKKAVDEAMKQDDDKNKELIQQRKETYAKLLEDLNKYLDKEQKDIETKRTTNNKKDIQGLKQKLIDGQLTQEEFDRMSVETNIKYLEQKQTDDNQAFANRKAALLYNYQAELLGFDEFITAYNEAERLDQETRTQNEITLTDAKQERDLTNKQKQMDGDRDFQEQMLSMEEAYTQATLDQKMLVAEAIGTLGGIISGFAADSKEAQIAGLLIQQGASVAQIITQAAASIAQTRIQANSVPAFIGTFPNPVYIAAQLIANKNIASTKLSAGIGIGSAIAGTIQGISQINASFNKKNEKKQFGGILEGPLHQNGGITTPFGELEGGEYVINRASTLMFRPQLDTINSLGGGSVSQLNTNGSSTLQTQPIIKTYVVASEMSSQQELDRVIKNRSLI